MASANNHLKRLPAVTSFCLRLGMAAALFRLLLLRSRRERALCRRSRARCGQAQHDLHAARAAAERARRAGDSACEAKERLIRSLSHELRTPLSPVLIAVQMLQRTQGLDESMRKTLAVIRRNVEKEARLIDHLLDMQPHGGDITECSPGAGQDTADVSRPVSSGPTRKPSGPPRGSSLRILLVEDNEDIAATTAWLLESVGYDVERAGDLRHALHAAEHARFDVLISDLGLPDGSGLDLMRQLRERGVSLKGIVCSGYGQDEDVRRSLQAGFDVHLKKPVDANLLVEKVDAMMT
jgi:CheY-like chemotaxis protein